MLVHILIFVPNTNQKKKTVEHFCPSTFLSAILPSPFSDGFQYPYYAFFSCQYTRKIPSYSCQMSQQWITPGYSVFLCHFLFIINSNLYWSLIVPDFLHFLLYWFLILILALMTSTNCSRLWAKSCCFLTGSHDFWLNSSHRIPVLLISFPIYNFLSLCLWQTSPSASFFNSALLVSLISISKWSESVICDKPSKSTYCFSEVYLRSD